MATRKTSRADINRSAVLAYLGAHGPTSRADLARALSLSPALMTSITKDLLAEGLVRELEHSASQGGRPARMLGLVATAGCAIGVKVAADHVALVEVGIDGTVHRFVTEPFDAFASTLLADLTSLLRRFIDGTSRSPLLGIGVGVPGSVDAQDSGIVESNLMQWHQVPIGPTLRRELDLPVLVENDVNAVAVAELLYGQGRDVASFLAITIGTGIGAGIVIDGVMLRGSGGAAGEIGHIQVTDDGRECACGNYGCLESVIGEAALVKLARKQGVIRPADGIAALRIAADSGDAAARAIYADAGALLGRTVAGLVLTLNPEVIIVLGEGTDAWEHWQVGFEPAVRSSLMPILRGVAVAVDSWADDSWAQGAAALVLATPFDSDGPAGDQGRLVRARLVEQAVLQSAGV